MLEIKKHRIMLLQILKDIYSDISISPTLGFKGGTASYFFYKLPRFSVALDFDLIDPEKEQIVYENVGNILKTYGKIKDSCNKRNTLFFLLSYENETNNIKIEISKRIFGSAFELKDYLGISMIVMKKEDMFAHKLVSMLERKHAANRDLFDIWYFLKQNWDINGDIVKLRTKQNITDYLNLCINFVEKTSEKHLLAGMGELLDPKTKNWVKQNLKKELLFLLKARADS